MIFVRNQNPLEIRQQTDHTDVGKIFLHPNEVKRKSNAFVNLTQDMQNDNVPQRHTIHTMQPI